MLKIISAAITLIITPASVCANAWLSDVDVIKIGAYQDYPAHYVWLSSGPGAECEAANPSNPTLQFSEQAPGGKSLMSVLMTAIVAKRKVDVQVSGCNIVEVYFK